MLDEEEFAAWDAVFGRCMQLAKLGRQGEQSIEGIDTRFREARFFYSQLTGAAETDHREIRHLSHAPGAVTYSATYPRRDHE